MGEVFRARDTRLGRDVAVKVLPDALAADTERLARFEREAKVLASLNHPNIAHIYGLEEREGAGNGRRGVFLVMELIGGEDLAQWIARGPMSLDEALPIAKQIAEALAAAHEQGIVHRDLKPANIRVLPDNQVKILDFGLAKMTEKAVAPAALMNSPTYTGMAGTAAGIILGTAAYMSPEQARGMAVDERSDIFSFGCVLYEMLSGRPAFQGHTASDILAGVLKSEPDHSLLPADLDPRIRSVLRRTLAKSLRDRWHSIGDVRYEIEQVMAQPTDRAAIARRAVPGEGWRAWVFAGVGLLTAAATSWLWLQSASAGIDAPVLRLSLNPPAGMELLHGVISPDGRRAVLRVRGAEGTASPGDAPSLWVRELGSFETRRVEGASEDISGQLFWSPDSRSIGFFANGKLKVSVEGGAPEVLADASTPRGGAWNAQGVILFVPTSQGPLVRLPATGGTGAPLVHTQPFAPLGPQFLPDGNHFLFLAQVGPIEKRTAYIGALDSEQLQALPSIRSPVVYSPTGHLVFSQGGRVMAQAFNDKTLTLEGNPVTLGEGVPTSVSGTGVLMYGAGVPSGTQMTWFDRAGRRVGAIGRPDRISTFRLAPDQSRVAIDRSDPEVGKRDIWVIDDLASGIASRLTADPEDASTPLWSPDGARILYRSSHGGESRFFVRDSRGDGGEQPVKEDVGGQISIDDWSKDGRYVVYRQRNNETQWDMRLLPMNGDTPRSFLKTPFNEGQGRVSPDGRWIAYASDESGRLEVYVQSFPSPGGKRRISSDGGSWPRWRGNGAELFYMADGLLMSVPVTTGDTFTMGMPAPLFRVSFRGGGPIGLVDPLEVSLDGQKFLLLALPNDDDRFSMSVIVNWPSLLATR
jgi:hypothetical protein